jgi:riboflavin biosynthesis pyrimidine reductase
MNRPYILVNFAMTTDGKIDSASRKPLPYGRGGPA